MPHAARKRRIAARPVPCGDARGGVADRAATDPSRIAHAVAARRMAAAHRPGARAPRDRRPAGTCRLVPVALVAAGAVGAVAGTAQARDLAGDAAAAEPDAGGAVAGGERGFVAGTHDPADSGERAARGERRVDAAARRGERLRLVRADEPCGVRRAGVAGLDRAGGRLAARAGTPRGTQRARLRSARRSLPACCRRRDQCPVDPAGRAPAALAFTRARKLDDRAGDAVVPGRGAVDAVVRPRPQLSRGGAVARHRRAR